jgi:hypothetical protein
MKYIKKNELLMLLYDCDIPEALYNAQFIKHNMLLEFLELTKFILIYC